MRRRKLAVSNHWILWDTERYDVLLLINIGRKDERGSEEGKGKRTKTIHVLNNSQKDKRKNDPFTLELCSWHRRKCGFHCHSLISHSLISYLPSHGSSLPHSLPLTGRTDLHSIHQVT